MTVNRVGFCSILPDNEEVYYSYLQGAISSVDENSSLQLTRKNEGVAVRLFPSIPMYVNSLVKIINDINNIFGIKVNFSKSMKSSSAIQFTIDFEK